MVIDETMDREEQLICLFEGYMANRYGGYSREDLEREITAAYDDHYSKKLPEGQIKIGISNDMVAFPVRAADGTTVRVINTAVNNITSVSYTIDPTCCGVYIMSTHDEYFGDFKIGIFELIEKYISSRISKDAGSRLLKYTTKDTKEYSRINKLLERIGWKKDPFYFDNGDSSQKVFSWHKVVVGNLPESKND